MTGEAAKQLARDALNEAGIKVQSAILRGDATILVLVRRRQAAQAERVLAKALADWPSGYLVLEA